MQSFQVAINVLHDMSQISADVASVTVPELLLALKAAPEDQPALSTTLWALHESIRLLGSAQQTLITAVQQLGASAPAAGKMAGAAACDACLASGTLPTMAEPQGEGEISLACSPRSTMSKVPSLTTMQLACIGNNQGVADDKEAAQVAYNGKLGIQYQLNVPVHRRRASAASGEDPPDVAVVASRARARGFAGIASTSVRLAARGTLAVVSAPLRLAWRLAGRGGIPRSGLVSRPSCPRPSYFSVSDSFRAGVAGSDDESVVWPDEDASDVDFSPTGSGDLPYMVSKA